MNISIMNRSGYDHCIICDAYVPEGRQVCGLCERRVEDGKILDRERERILEAISHN